MDFVIHFVVSKDKYEILCAEITSNNRTIDVFNLRPDSYYECEWLEDNPNSLKIHVKNKDTEIEDKIRTTILEKYNTRADLLDDLFHNAMDRTFNRNGNLYVYGNTSIPENIRVGGYLILSGCS